MSRTTSILATGACLAISLGMQGGCASKPAPQVRQPIPAAQQTETSLPAPRARSDSGPSNVAIAEDIRRACGISDAEAYFAYDSASVRAEDRTILKKLADCFTTGALKGREMRLVGHADPRGDEEYNYLLGQRRADSVKLGIVSSGIAADSVATTSRGEDEAKGANEDGWVRDRRVEVLLAN